MLYKKGRILVTCYNLFLWPLLEKLHLNLLHSVDQQKVDHNESINSTLSPSELCSQERGNIRDCSLRRVVGLKRKTSYWKQMN